MPALHEHCERPKQWYAVSTNPRHEKSALSHLAVSGIEAFLPTYESSRVWKNRQKVALTLPLFPTYLFVRIGAAERIQVLKAPGVRQVVGTRSEPLPVPEHEVEALRRVVAGQKLEPFRGLVIGQRVRVTSGPMQGIEGCLVRHSSDWRFVLTVQLIHQHAAVEVDALALEPITE